MAENRSRSSGQDAETCEYLDFMTWQQSYLTNDTRTSSTALIILLSVTSMATVALNLLVIQAVRTRKRLRNNGTILLACLAGTDLMSGALIQPLLIALELRHILTDGPFCVVDTACMLVVYLGCLLSFYHLLLVSLDRFVAIKHHLRYEAIMTRQRLKMGIALAWALPLVEIFGKFVMMQLRKYDSWLWYFPFLIDILYISGMIYINVNIYFEAMRAKKRLRSEQIPQEQAIKLQKSNKAAVTVSIILGTLLMTCLPYIMLEIMAGVFPALVQSRVFYILSSWFVFIASCSSLLNPLVYCCRMKKLRRAFLEILHLRHKENVAEFEMNCGTREQFKSPGGENHQASGTEVAQRNCASFEVDAMAIPSCAVTPMAKEKNLSSLKQ